MKLRIVFKSTAFLPSHIIIQDCDRWAVQNGFLILTRTDRSFRSISLDQIAEFATVTEA